MIDSRKKHVLIYGDAFVDYIAEDQFEFDVHNVSWRCNCQCGGGYF